MAENNPGSFPYFFGSPNTQGNTISQNSNPQSSPNPQFLQVPYQQFFPPNFPNVGAMGSHFGMQHSQAFMYPPPQTSPDFRNLSMRDSSSDKEIGSSFPFVAAQQFPPHSTQPGVKDTFVDVKEKKGRHSSKAKRPWSHDEESCLAQAWGTISNCSKVGNAQKNKEFWEKLATYYNENKPEGTATRSGTALKSHYYAIIPDVNAFSGVYNNFYSNRASGQSDEDVFAASIAHWNTVNPTKTFKYIHVWKIMKELEKWAPLQMDQHANKKSKTSESEGHTSESSIRSRPMGQQRAKRLGKGKLKVADEDEDEDEDEKWEKLNKLHVERIKQKDEELKLKEYEIFMKDTSGLSAGQLAVHNKLIEEIRVKRGW